MNPKKFGKLANHKQETWKRPLGEYIKELYSKRFRKPHPDNVRPIEELVKEHKKKQEARKQRRLSEKEEENPEGNGSQPRR
ncbi:MAG: hypothetical protein MUP68_05880 [Deltaproteobacteria bacterium]|nr:hypothetical protein [Deltaproteobacteria bacterium]